MLGTILHQFQAPEMVKRSLDNMKPAALVAKPLKAFNKETTTGISAPPIGNTMLTPKKPQKAVLAKRQALEEIQTGQQKKVNGLNG